MEMKSRWLVLLVVVLLAGAPAFFANTSSETSEETEAADVNQTPTPTPAKKASASKGGPQIDLGTPARSTSSPPPDGASLSKPPARLSTAGPRSSPPAAPATAWQNFIVALDVGHSKASGGAVSANGKFEYEFNRRLAGELFDALRSTGFPHALLINPGGGEIGLVKRAQVANERQADVFLAIHHDSVKDNFLKDWKVNGQPQKYCDDFRGYSVFFSRKNAAAAGSRAFAFEIGEALLQAGFKPTLHHVAQEHRPIVDPKTGVYAFDDLLVLKNAKMPAVLLECGVIVNRDEEKDLDSAKYRSRMIVAIESAIAKYADTAATPAKGN
jgi:N-acetylmuramoyl-L-alanine amidase